jgi:dUTP pyrophosphatase
MKFLNENGQEITLKRSETLPGYEVTLAEDTVIDSAVNNPLFKGINVLQLPKKLKGFRDNQDLQTLLAPKALNTGVKLELADDEFALFEPKLDLVTSKRLQNVNRVFGDGQEISPQFINFGLKKVKLNAGVLIGYLIIQKAVLD